MEVEKNKNKNKNKRVIRDEAMKEKEESESERLKKLKGEEEAAAGTGSSGVPTEEEVEEFFTILRRMKVAVKYFDDKGRGGKEWRETLEQADVMVDDDENIDGEDREVGRVADDKIKKGGREVIINDDLDLNAVAPEAAESGGA